MTIRGRRNSSLTRVRPFFGQLIDKDPTGAGWLRELLGMTQAGQQLLGELDGDPGTLLAECVKPRPYADRILQQTIGLSACFEHPLPPAEAFLRWAIRNPDRLTWPGWPHDPRTYGEDTQQRRENLFGVDPERRAQVQDDAESELDKHRAAGSRAKWWAFEGWTEVDCCLQTDRLVLLIEGKRTESLSASTDWLPQRSQLVRNLEVVEALAGDRRGAVLLMTEVPVPGVLDA